VLPKIIKIEVLDDYKLMIYLDDKTNFIFDFRECLNYPCNAMLRDYKIFKQAKWKSRMVYWDDMHDIHLDQMIPEVYLKKWSAS
jgi:hypothetical protein